MRYWYGLLGFVGVVAILGVGTLVVWPISQSITASQTTITTPPKLKAVKVTINPPTETTGVTTLTFVGDVMLDRYVRTTINRHTPVWPFESIRGELLGDVVIGNLEGPFTQHASVATNTNLIFTFDPDHVPGLASAGFTHFSLANNHTLNFGQAGLEATRATLTGAGLKFFGDPKNRSGSTTELKVNGQLITLIGYHGLVSGRESVLQEIQLARGRGELVIIFAHWGNEYQLQPSARQRADAHALVDAGADIIIGAHPHVVQPFEVYQGKFIAYSLGNFLFDQYFSAETLSGLVLRLTLDDQVLGVDLIPVVTVAGQVRRLEGAARDRLLERLADTSTVANQEKDTLRRGRITIPYVPPTN